MTECAEWSKKVSHQLFCHNCVKYWPIFKILSLAPSAEFTNKIMWNIKVNFQTSIDILRGSAAKHLTHGGMFNHNDHFIADLLKELLKIDQYLMKCWSYRTWWLTFNWPHRRGGETAKRVAGWCYTLVRLVTASQSVEKATDRDVWRRVVCTAVKAASERSTDWLRTRNLR